VAKKQQNPKDLVDKRVVDKKQQTGNDRFGFRVFEFQRIRVSEH
jgi:hypothetical protein